MLPRLVTGLYLAYLAAPIVLLFVGSFGDLWLNTLFPTGLTGRWYLEVASDPSFRRAFVASLTVGILTCGACLAIGLPLAYAIFRTRNPQLRALVGALYQLPVALPPLVLATGIGEARNAIIARAALCLVAIGDNFGTLSEVALGRQFGKLVIGLEGAAAVPGVVHVENVAAALEQVARCALNAPAGH